MKKKINSLVSIFVFILLLISGCSKKDIEKIEIVDGSIKNHYIVGESLDINEFKVKIITKNKKENTYLVTNDMYTLSEIDNTLLGAQNLRITVNYKNNSVVLNTEIYFSLPEVVINVISIIDELPAVEVIDLSHEDQLINADNAFNALSDFYKNYVNNYNELVAKIETYQNYFASTITPYVINQRYILTNGLEKYLNSIDKANYSSTSWDIIISIYDEGINRINSSIDSNLMNNIVDETRKNISAVKTLKILAFEEEISTKKEQLIEYKEGIDLSLYSDKRKQELNSILEAGLNIISNATTSEKLLEYYNNVIDSIDNVLTIEEENILQFNVLINAKVNEVNSYYKTLNLNLYSQSNKTLINNKLDESIANIRSSASLSEMDTYIVNFKKYVSKVLTLEEENEILLANTRLNCINDINNLYSSISLYEYDSQNRIFIEMTISQAINSIDLSTSINEIITIRNTTYSTISKVLTMEQQALINLEKKINKLYEDLDNYITNLGAINYSEDNWNIILNIVSNAKIKFSDEISVLTANITITNMYNKVISSIDEIKTIEGEKTILLNNTKDSAINELDTYYNSLNESDFDSLTYQNITNKINLSKKTISNLNSVEEINKLVQDTIKAIELVR